MLDVTDRDIAELDDGDLRSLVAFLCEASLRQACLSTSAVTWGGHQDAPDGGLDVRVDLPADIVIHGYVPRPTTGLQVKKPDMKPAAIHAEMRPGGVLRPAIQELAARGGAYVIASSAASLSDAALAKRRAAMRQAVVDVPGGEHLALDFYDRRRLASWVADHPGLVPWVRAKAGRPMQGWQSHGAWAHSLEGERAEYLVGEEARLHEIQGGQELSVTGGLEAVRNRLRVPGKAVRLIGLSGVGKTRFVQAVFDARVGAEALAPTLAFYTNLSDEPEPPPVALTTSLIAQQRRATLVVDNCPPDLHRRLAELVRAAGSSVSVLTVEYDVSDDQPEGTEVFRLEAASEELVGRLLRLRFPELSAVNTDVIAENSGGNARIAIALAETVGKGQSLAGLSDRTLFLRLFRQRNEDDASLLGAAEVCSLAYSFDGEELGGDEAELPRLAALAELSAREVYRHVQELMRRGLAQKRGKWRAILPQAIANRLAEQALDKLPREEIMAQLVHGASERLARSFSRRLGHLHRSGTAVRIAEEWLAPSGLLGDLAALNDFGRTLFTNIAPLAPAATLEAVERAVVGSNGDSLLTGASAISITRLLRSLAFDADLFERSASLLIGAALLEEPDNNTNSVADLFTSMFSILLSGTHATLEQRTATVDGLLRSDEARQQELGLKALEAALQVSHFTSVYGFSFGAHPRDHGWRPSTGDDVLRWFGTFVSMCQKLGCSSEPVAPRVRTLLAQRFHELWTAAGAHDVLENAARAFSDLGSWNEGWAAVRRILYLDRKGMETCTRERLEALDALLAPRDLAERVRARILSNGPLLFDAVDEEDEDAAPTSIARAMTRAQARTEELGSELAGNAPVFSQLLPDLVFRDRNADLLWHLGRGLGQAALQPVATWQALADALRATSEEDTNLAVVQGFLDGLHARDPGRVDALLDQAVQDGGLALWFPTLQGAVELDRAGLGRLHRSLHLGIAPIRAYGCLQYCRLADDVSDADFAGLIEIIASKERGVAVALDILAMRLHGGHPKEERSPHLVSIGRQLLHGLTSAEHLCRQGYLLARSVEACTFGVDGHELAIHLCCLVRDALENPNVGHGLYEITKVLLRTQPAIALPAFLQDARAKRNTLGWSALESLKTFGRNLLDELAPDVILTWCDENPALNYPLAAAAVRFETAAREGGGLSWTEIALQLIAKAPDRLVVLRSFVERFDPRSWTGSRAAILSSRAQLLTMFEQDVVPEIAAYARSARDKLERWAAQQRRWEVEHSREQDERFK